MVFSGGLLAVALALAGFPIAADEVAWIALALVLGVASGAVNTMANLFVVEAHGKDEWDTRIGWLQTFYNGGTVGGLLLAGAFSHLPLEEYLELDVGLFAASWAGYNAVWVLGVGYIAAALVLTLPFGRPREST